VRGWIACGLKIQSYHACFIFTDWLEFSPYEIGMAKYGTFMQTQQFGSKFFNGVLVKQYEESPLHFLIVCISNYISEH